jgi:choline dehydrogenase-like flavoprotein
MGARYDVIVAGGGTAGCALAARLSEDPARRVCLVEAGPDYGPHDSGRWPDDILDARTLALDSHRWAQSSEDRSQARARIIGGCSSHNACALVRGEPRDYDEWPAGWRAADLEPYLDRAEAQLRGRFFAEEELTPWHRTFAEAGGELVHRHPFNVVGSLRWNAAFAYLDPARERANLDIVPDTIVDRVLLEGGRAGGVATPDGELRAPLVVLAAGAYGTPAILLRTGLGPPVGEELADHVGIGIGWEPTQDLQSDCAAFEAEHPLFMAGVTIRVEDLFFFPALDPGYEISAGVFFMKPRSRGTVRLTASDPEAPLAIDHGFLSDPADVQPLVDGLERVRALDLAPYAGRELRPADRDPHEYVRAEARGFFHPTGTAAWGRVTDEQCRVDGVEGLVVGDASLLPTLPRANTNLTVAAVAERLAELL